MYRNENNIYINKINLDITEYIKHIHLVDDKYNIRSLNCSNNRIHGPLTDIPFPNLKKLELQNNKISSIEYALPDKLEYLCIDNNEFVELPPLPNNLKTLYCHGNPIFQLPVFPASLKRLRIHIDSIDIHSQSYECKKSIVILLNKTKFQHNFTSSQLLALLEFKRKEREYSFFLQALMYDAQMKIISFHTSVENQYNPILHILRLLFVSISLFL